MDELPVKILRILDELLVKILRILDQLLIMTIIFNKSKSNEKNIAYMCFNFNLLPNNVFPKLVSFYAKPHLEKKKEKTTYNPQTIHNAHDKKRHEEEK